MSRLDWFTIAVVGICLAAIVFLLSRAMNWSSITGEDGDKTELQEDLEEAGLLDDETIDPESSDSDSEDLSDESGSGDAGSDESGDVSGDSGSDAAGGGDEASDSDTSFDDTDDGFEDDEVPVNTSPSRTNGEYIVIAGSFSLMHNAENYAAKLRKKGYPNAYVAKFNAGKFASVIIDAYDSSAEASEMVSELKAAGIDAFSKRRRGN